MEKEMARTPKKSNKPSPDGQAKQQHKTCKKIAVEVLEQHVWKAAQDCRRVSSETIQLRYQVVVLGIDIIKREGGFDLQSPFNLKQKHLFFLGRYWESKQLAASTLQNRWSIWKMFCNKWLKKNGFCRPIEHYLLNPDAAKRTYAAQEDHSWSAKVDPLEKIKEVAAIDVIVARQLMLQLLFGLRRKEAIMFKPIAYDHGTVIELTDGTKGGRRRLVPVETETQRAFLDSMKQLAKYRNTSMGHPGLRLDQDLNRFNYVMAKAGLTRKDAGLTSHGLRHQYANDRLEFLSGQPSPVRSGKAPVDLEAFNAAREIVTEELGHSRISITTAYHGSPTKPPKKPEPDGQD